LLGESLRLLSYSYQGIETSALQKLSAFSACRLWCSIGWETCLKWHSNLLTCCYHSWWCRYRLS